jgi:hypothetical protein
MAIFELQVCSIGRARGKISVNDEALVTLPMDAVLGVAVPVKTSDFGKYEHEIDNYCLIVLDLLGA